jgi:hypothetical protein
MAPVKKKRKKSTHGQHRTRPVKGGRKGRRKRATRPAVAVDPAKPANAVYSTLDKHPVYGAEFKFDWTVGGCFNASCTQKHANITTAGWKEKYIVSVKVAGIPNLGAMRLHKRIAVQFEAFFKAAIVKGLANKVLNFEGAFTARTITNNQARLSNHALGTAIDINTVQNGYGAQPAARGATGSLSEFADYCTDFGLYWGGWYERNKDAMHFEAVKVLTAAELQAACTTHGVVYATLTNAPAGPTTPPVMGPR